MGGMWVGEGVLAIVRIGQGDLVHTKFLAVKNISKETFEKKFVSIKGILYTWCYRELK